MALDPIGRRLYFTNMGTHLAPVVNSRGSDADNMSGDGSGSDGTFWSRIEWVSLDRKQRYTVTTAVEKPRGLALDLDHG